VERRVQPPRHSATESGYLDQARERKNCPGDDGRPKTEAQPTLAATSSVFEARAPAERARSSRQPCRASVGASRGRLQGRLPRRPPTLRGRERLERGLRKPAPAPLNARHWEGTGARPSASDPSKCLPGASLTAVVRTGWDASAKRIPPTGVCPTQTVARIRRTAQLALSDQGRSWCGAKLGRLGWRAHRDGLPPALSRPAPTGRATPRGPSFGKSLGPTGPKAPEVHGARVCSPGPACRDDRVEGRRRPPGASGSGRPQPKCSGTGTGAAGLALRWCWVVTRRWRALSFHVKHPPGRSSATSSVLGAEHVVSTDPMRAERSSGEPAPGSRPTPRGRGTQPPCASTSTSPWEALSRTPPTVPTPPPPTAKRSSPRQPGPGPDSAQPKADSAQCRHAGSRPDSRTREEGPARSALEPRGKIQRSSQNRSRRVDEGPPLRGH
jgi:hypothetical protein